MASQSFAAQESVGHFSYQAQALNLANRCTKALIELGCLGVLDLTDVLELIIDHFNQGSLPQENLVDQVQQPRFYVFAEPDDQFDSLNPQEFEDFVAEVATISKEDLFDQQDCPVMVNTAWSEANSQQVATVIQDQVQFNFEELSHGGLTPSWPGT